MNKMSKGPGQPKENRPPTAARIARLLPPYGHPQNPCDVTGGALADPEVDLEGILVSPMRSGGVELLVDVITRVAQLAVALAPAVESVEVNPLLVNGNQVEALDALITPAVN